MVDYADLLSSDCETYGLIHFANEIITNIFNLPSIAGFLGKIIFAAVCLVVAVWSSGTKAIAAKSLITR